MGPKQGPPPLGHCVVISTYQPLGTGWHLLNRTQIYCRSLPSPDSLFCSAQRRVGSGNWTGPIGDKGLPFTPLMPYHQLEYIIRYIPLARTDVVGRGVTEDDWGLGILQSILHGGHRHMGQVNHDTQTVHLLQHSLEVGEEGLEVHLIDTLNLGHGRSSTGEVIINPLVSGGCGALRT